MFKVVVIIILSPPEMNGTTRGQGSRFSDFLGGTEKVGQSGPMVRLSRIYTKTGDDGSTGLGDGSRRPKHDIRIEAYGTSDELGSVLGLAISHGLDEELEKILLRVQNDLFDLGADLCVPGQSDGKLRIKAQDTTRLEGWIDQLNEGMKALDSFVLSGGRPAAAWLHLARCVCRRCERQVSELSATEDEDLNPEVLRYLNRLSDLLFVMARSANDRGEADVLWQPGGPPGSSD